MLLSICIPTFNREKYLKENIDEIISQIVELPPNTVEICISDNASTDSTKELIYYYVNKYPQLTIRYNLNNINLGADRNFIIAMQMATGSYSWLIGSDDVIVLDSINEILNYLNHNREIGIILFNRINCSINMEPWSTKDQSTFLREDIENQIFDFSKRFEEKYYYTLCRSFGGVFSFISSVVYSTNAIVSIPICEKAIGTNYSFLYYWLKYLKTGKKVHYIKNELVKCRHGLESFGSGFQRQLVDYKGIKKISDLVFNDKVDSLEFLSIFKFQYPSFEEKLFLYINLSKNDWIDFRSTLLSVYWKDTEIEFIEKFGSTVNVYVLKNRIKLWIKTYVLLRQRLKL